MDKIDWKTIESYKVGANFYIPQTEMMYRKICEELGREDDEIFDWFYDTSANTNDLKDILSPKTDMVELELVRNHSDGTASYAFKSSFEFDQKAAEYYSCERSDEATKKYLEDVVFEIGHGGEV